MKEVIKWQNDTKGVQETAMAYQPVDIEKLRPVLDRAAVVWNHTWREQGATDEGSCCGGKGIQVVYLGKRKRHWEYLTVITSPPVQGNLSAARSVQPALDYLKSEGIDAKYYDGWMG
tara:strand:- start:57 stop:407 length:351 start_codon:yes stop_codon:yes gene_type:complete